MKRSRFFLSFALLLFLAFPSFAKDEQSIGLGQYVLEDETLHLLTTPISRYDHPLAPRIQPIANLGNAKSYITSISTSAAGKWQVVFSVFTESANFDVTFQLASGDEWKLYAVSPQDTLQIGKEIVLKVISISNNQIKVKILDSSKN
mgnify:CR=1 FL=1